MIDLSGIYCHYYYGVNETIKFEPLLTVSYPDNSGDLYILWDDDYNSYYYSYDVFASYVTSFDSEGKYSIRINILTSDGTTVVVSGFPPIVVSNFPDYDENKIRTYETTELALPYTKEQVRVGENDWVTSDVINAAIDRLQDNIKYIENISTMYKKPPIKYMGWLGSKWHIQNIDSDSKDIGNHFNSLNDICVNNEGHLILAENTMVLILSSNYYADFIDIITEKSVNDPLVNVKSVQTDSENNIYVLDSIDGGYNPRVIVYSFDLSLPTPHIYKYSWGGYGGQIAKNKFRSPNSLKVDSTNSVWVADTGNNCIKKYSSTGSWITTITSDYFSKKSSEYDYLYSIFDGSPIDMAIDGDGFIHVLTSNYVVKFTSNYNFVKTYNWNFKGIFNNEIPRKIIASRDNGILYILFKKKVLRISTNGINLGIFGYDLFGNDLSSILDYKGIYHDKNRNILLANNYENNKCIIKYVDSVEVMTAYFNYPYPWPLSSIYINKNEYINDFVYNRTMMRLYDNYESLRRRMTGVVDRNSDNELYVRGRLASEWPVYKYNKSDIIIGINEFVTSDVINRNIDMLYDCQETLFKMISG